jgi:TrmH family RNA methyltransferase
VSDSSELIRRFQTARRDTGFAVLEGFHALKHALRFGAELLEVIASDSQELEKMAEELAPDLAPQAPRTGVVAIARRPDVDVNEVLGERRPAPLILLEDPRTMGNMGACVRVSAAADAAGVFTTGDNDPWHPDALRGAAGLHFALPVTAIEGLPDSDRPLVAIDPDGQALRPSELPPRAILAFGSERHGLSDGLLGKADMRLGIPMRNGVSSLNLATSVAAVLFAQRL